MERDLLYVYQGLKDTTKEAEPVEDHLPASIHQGPSNLHSDKDMEDKIKVPDPRVQKLIRTYLEVFGELPPPASCDKLLQMDLKLKPEFVGHKIRRRPYPAPKEQADEIERQVQECINAGLVLEYKDGDYPQHCSPRFLVAKLGSTAKRLVVDYGELNKKTLNHSGSIPNMESTLEKMASCRYKTKMDKRSGFRQLHLTPNDHELLAFITPQGRVFKWKVMPFGVANAPALFQELMNKILSILRRRPVVQELITRGIQMEAHIDNVCLGTNTQEDHLIPLGEFFAVCQENHTRLNWGSVTSCRRLCSTWRSPLAMGGGPQRPLRWVVNRLPWQEPPRLQLLGSLSPAAPREPAPLLWLLGSQSTTAPEEPTPLGPENFGGGTG